MAPRPLGVGPLFCLVASTACQARTTPGKGADQPVLECRGQAVASCVSLAGVDDLVSPPGVATLVGLRDAEQQGAALSADRGSPYKPGGRGVGTGHVD